MGHPDTRENRRLAASLNRWFRTPPRLHGNIDRNRTVGFLELFYDLVFVVIVAQLAHHLVGHVTWTTVTEFAILFGLIWVAWMNGSLYHEMHGREDGRHRSYVFGQMYFLLLLAVFAGDATGNSGRAFALTYAGLLSLVTYQWWVVARLDRVPLYARIARQYVISMLVMIAITVVSAFVSEPVRLALWACVVLIAVTEYVVNLLRQPDDERAVHPTESMTERFGLFTIIGLGEVITGIVNGILDADATTSAVVVGLLALTVCFGLWWNYFDALGRRLSRDTGWAVIAHMLLHLPLWAAIAAAGAGMVSLIEHAGDPHLDAATTWLLAGTTALFLVLVAMLLGTIDRVSYPTGVARYQLVLVLGGVAALGTGLLHPPSWALAAILASILGSTWFIVFTLRARAGDFERKQTLAAEQPGSTGTPQG